MASKQPKLKRVARGFLIFLLAAVVVLYLGPPAGMGVVALLGAASQYPAIQAIAADGATRRSTEELLALESERPLARNFTARVMYATVRALTGEAPPKPMLESMLESKSTRFLLIAAGGNSLEMSF